MGLPSGITIVTQFAKHIISPSNDKCFMLITKTLQDILGGGNHGSERLNDLSKATQLETVQGCHKGVALTTPPSPLPFRGQLTPGCRRRRTSPTGPAARCRSAPRRARARCAGCAGCAGARGARGAAHAAPPGSSRGGCDSRWTTPLGWCPTLKSHTRRWP